MQLLKRILTLLLLMVVLLFGVLFSIQNTATAPLDLLFIQLPEQRIVIWILSAFSIGGVVGILSNSLVIIRLQREKMSAQRQLKKRGIELEKLRSTDLLTTNLATSVSSPVNPKV